MEEGSIVCIAQMSVKVQEAISSLYEEYTNKLKPVLAFEESVAQNFPGPILNEIRAINDHISRCYWAEKTEQSVLRKSEKPKGICLALYLMHINI